MPLSIGFLGPAGTYSEEAAWIFSQHRPGCLVPFTGIESVIRAVADGQIDYGVTPIENSLEGSVNITLDTLAHDVNLSIIREIVLPISHSLYVADQTIQIKSIASHPQALAQCRRFIAAYYPNVQLQAVESTAAAASLVAKGSADAAIASWRAGQLFKLIPVRQDIQDHYCNQTRFVVLSRQPELDSAVKTSLVCRIRGDKPGSLCQMLSEFSNRNVNLTRIESRPARTGLGEYIFFIDLDGALHQACVAEAIQAVAANSLWLKNLGMYAVDHPQNKR